jgi:hypothetical protein
MVIGVFDGLIIQNRFPHINREFGWLRLGRNFSEKKQRF